MQGVATRSAKLGSVAQSTARSLFTASTRLNTPSNNRHSLIVASAEPTKAEAGDQTAPKVFKPQALTPAWENAVELLSTGVTVQTTITNVNKSGVLVQIGKLQGFVPYKLMDRKRLATAGPTEASDFKEQMVGQNISVKVVQVVVPERRLVCSEKAARLDEVAAGVAAGDVIEGRISSLHDFGAFIEVIEPAKFAGAEVILPLREVSWDWIPTVGAFLTRDQVVTVRVMAVNGPPSSKVVVSLKRMQQDPLEENLDNMLPLGGAAGYKDTTSGLSEVSADVPSGVEDILAQLSQESGIEEVTLGRRVEEKRTVSQDLELWMTKEEVQDGFNLVARAGRTVQEIHVKTKMGVDDMRGAVQRVLKRVN